MTAPRTVREEMHADLRAYATKVFAARPELKSLLMAVAQYWADEADDAVHAYVVASERDVPMWPHVCRDPEDGDGQTIGEHCEYCCDDLDYLPFDDNGSSIVGFASYCHEHGSQEEPQDENYLPYAIVRRDGSVELVGHVLRGYDELPEDDRELVHLPIAPDDRTKKLYEDACHEGDDGPRRVLADYLLERGDPRGEYMALALADVLDTNAIAQRDAMLAEYARTWMFPLRRVVLPPPMSRFERGLLSHAEICTRDEVAIEGTVGSTAWHSVESIRILPDSFDIVDPAMIALRRLGPIGSKGLAALQHSYWRIEDLAVRLDSAADWNALRTLATLTKLRALTVSGSHVPAPYRPAFGPDSELVTAPWWPALERFIVLAPSTEIDAALPWLQATSGARAMGIAELGYHGGPAGWQLAYRHAERLIEVEMPGFSATGRRARLIELLDRGPDGRIELIGGRCWRPTADDIAAISATGRSVTIR